MVIEIDRDDAKRIVAAIKDALDNYVTCNCFVGRCIGTCTNAELQEAISILKAAGA